MLNQVRKRSSIGVSVLAVLSRNVTFAWNIKHRAACYGKVWHTRDLKGLMILRETLRRALGDECLSLFDGAYLPHLPYTPTSATFFNNYVHIREIVSPDHIVKLQNEVLIPVQSQVR